MDEKLYKTVGRSGGANIAIGIVSIVIGVGTGVLLIIAGARLLASRAKIMF